MLKGVWLEIVVIRVSNLIVITHAVLIHHRKILGPREIEIDQVFSVSSADTTDLNYNALFFLK